jgi:hypothetical protein
MTNKIKSGVALSEAELQRFESAVELIAGDIGYFPTTATPAAPALAPVSTPAATEAVVVKPKRQAQKTGDEFEFQDVDPNFCPEDGETMPEVCLSLR